jgi:hypothetical protein
MPSSSLSPLEVLGRACRWPDVVATFACPSVVCTSARVAPRSSAYEPCAWRSQRGESDPSEASFVQGNRLTLAVPLTQIRHRLTKPCRGSSPTSQLTPPERSARGFLLPSTRLAPGGARLPNARHEAITHARGVIGVARQVGFKRILFPHRAQSEEGDKDEADRKRVPGSKQQRRAEKKEDRACVHGMAHPRIFGNYR